MIEQHDTLTAATLKSKAETRALLTLAVSYIYLGQCLNRLILDCMNGAT